MKELSYIRIGNKLFRIFFSKTLCCISKSSQPKCVDFILIDLSKFTTLCVKLSTIEDKTNVTLLQFLLSPCSMLINERLRQREAEFSTKAPTTANLQHWNGDKGGNGNIRVDFLALHQILSRIVGKFMNILFLKYSKIDINYST